MAQRLTGTGKTHLAGGGGSKFLCGIGISSAGVDCGAPSRAEVEQIEETTSRYGMGKEPDKTGKNGKTGKDSMPEESGRVQGYSPSSGCPVTGRI